MGHDVASQTRQLVMLECRDRGWDTMYLCRDLELEVLKQLKHGMVPCVKYDLLRRMVSQAHGRAVRAQLGGIQQGQGRDFKSEERRLT